MSTLPVSNLPGSNPPGSEPSGSTRPYDTGPAAPGSSARADEDSRAALRRLAEICIEAHGIVAREGPAEVRLPLEVLLCRIGRQLGGEAEGEAGAAEPESAVR